MTELINFYKNKNVFITGHTGFKGTWLTKILLMAGARVTGYSKDIPTKPSLYEKAGLSEFCKDGQLNDIRGDIRNLNALSEAFRKAKPEIVFHLAAQPIVRESYRDPVGTYETNVMGTVNIMDCIRRSDSVRSAVIITTDKVYHNNEWCWGYRECDPLDGYDPYSNSKSCAELVVNSYKNSFLDNADSCVSVSTARAGNVIGGGDFAADRIIPDCVRVMEKAYHSGNKEGVIEVRHPDSIRPYQHVLDPLGAYLIIACRQWYDKNYADSYNVGPDECDCVTTGNLVEKFCKAWNESRHDRFPAARWTANINNDDVHEASFLKLDSTKIRQRLGYKSICGIDECIRKTVTFSMKYLEEIGSVPAQMEMEIREHFK